MSDVRNDEAKSRYELTVDGETAIAVYQRQGDIVAFVHTEVPANLEGRGVGSDLIKGALADVRRQGLKALPACEFVQFYMKQHPEEQDLLP